MQNLVQQLAKDLRSWIEQEYELTSRPVIKPIVKEKPVIKKPSLVKEKPVVEEESAFADLKKWAAGRLNLTKPITPIVCIGEHPFWEKVVDALTQRVASASLLSLQEVEQMGWESFLTHPLLKILLIPPEISLPLSFSGSLLNLESAETYLSSESKKRELWNQLKSMSLSS